MVTISVCVVLTLFSVGALGVSEVILDTDIGDDIDDTWALMFLLASNKLHPKLIVTACDNTPEKTRLVAKMLEQVGRTDIPIGTGIKTSDKEINQSAWIKDYSIDQYSGTIHPNGVEKMVEMIRNARDKVTLCVIGPMMNIAKALEIAPDITEKAHVVCMAGSIYRGYGGKKERDCEYNVCRDVQSAKKVFSAPWKITLIPLDTCGTIILKGEKYLKVRDSLSPLAKVVIENYNIWTNRKHYPENESSVLFDTLAIYCIETTDGVKMSSIRLTIDDKGFTIPDENGKEVACALEWEDKEKFENILIDRLISYNSSMNR